VRDWQAETIDQVQELVLQAKRLRPRGGGTKPALSTPLGGECALELAHLRGVTEYASEEFTFTALAGTPLKEVDALLGQNGQHLPFDPPLAEKGATLGGTVAAGLSGPGRYQYGGVRDFILGVRYVDGEGRLVKAGGKVVKNVAGFDLPKLMIGSLGRLGVLVELTFKVFPRPEGYATLRLSCSGWQAAQEALEKLLVCALDVHAIDLLPEGQGVHLYANLAGMRKSLPARLSQMKELLGGGSILEEAEAASFWREQVEFTWAPPGWSLIKVPVTPRRIPGLEARLAGLNCLRRYSGGGQVAWLALPEPPGILEGVLLDLGLSALVLTGPPDQARLGVDNGELFEKRVKAALDPMNRFGGG
jgi:glycolate oxidase FAD binding subunit